ncbi:MAG: carbohydrate ABC transporter permease [Thermoprotei archaeon]|nr:MAG: carbohydrate ABC transporter permease [Thermoprotei archaeon]
MSRRSSTYYRNVIRKAKIRTMIGYIIVYSVLCIPLVPIVMMYGWLVIQAFSGRPVTWLIPNQPTLRNWYFLSGPIMKGGTVLYSNFWQLVGNTLLLALGTTGLVVIASSLAGYVISRFDFKGRDPLLKSVVVFHSLPGVLFLIALMYLLNYLGIYGKGFLTLLTVILIKAGLETPMYTWMLKGFFDSVPWELEWAALVDGCTRFQAWRRVVLPMIFPGIAAVSVFAFLSGWGEYLLVYVYITQKEYYTLSVALSDLTFEFLFIDYGMLAAFSLFYMIPAVIFFILTQKYLMTMRIIAYKG